MKMEMDLLLGNMGEYNTKDGPDLPHYYSHTTFEYIRGHRSLLRWACPPLWQNKFIWKKFRIEFLSNKIIFV